MREYPSYQSINGRWFDCLPSSWNVLRAKWIFSNEKERASDEDEQLAASQKYGVVPQKLMIELNNSNVMLALKGTDNFKKVRKNDFVISLRSFEGGIEYSEYDGCISPAYTVLRLREIWVEPIYFKYALKCNPFIQALNSTSEGIRDGKTITYDEFGELLLALPPQDDQQSIANFLDRETARIDKLIAEKQTFIKLLKEKRQALISHVVTKGLNPNVEMKNSGIEWIGDVPEHWDVKKIKYLSSNFMYGTSVDCNLTDDGYPVLRIPNIDGVTVNFNDLKYTSLDKNEASRYLVAEGDVLVIRTNGNPAIVGQSALFSSQEEFLFASYLIKLTPDRKINSNFFIQAMNSLSIRQALTFQSRTSVGNYNLNIPSLSNTYMAIPSIEEQIQIAKYLDVVKNKYDSIISETTQSLNYLAEHRTALISAAVTGKVDVRHFKEEAA